MSSVIAAVRPDSWNFPLLVHVLGAMILVGGRLTGASALAFARGDARFLRLGYWALLLVALPGYIVMRIGAQWIYSEVRVGRPARGSDVDRHRVHRRGRRCPPRSHRVDSRRDRRPPAPRRQGHRPPQGGDGDRVGRARGSPRRRVGDVRQARLTLRARPQRPRAPHQGARDRPSDTEVRRSPCG